MDAETRDIDRRAAAAAADGGRLLDEFIGSNEGFILKCASRHSGKFITKNDDEWAVALEAFDEAITSYSYEKGSFVAFARLIIARRITDLIRIQSRRSGEIPVDPQVFSGEAAEGNQADDIDNLRMELLDRMGEDERKAGGQRDVQESLKEEIKAVSEVFSRYGFSFYDLAACSPKADKTRRACARAVNWMAENPVLLSDMRLSRKLPITIIEKNLKIPRKILERHRKYIIAVLEISEGDYPYLSEYVTPFREECGK